MRFKSSVFPIAAALALAAAGCKDAGDTGTGPQRIGGTDSASRSRDPLASRTSSGGSGMGTTPDSARPSDLGKSGQGSSGMGATGSEQSVSGTLAQASADEVKVDTASQPGLKLKVNKSTRITVDGKDASASELREGAQVRASYQGSGDSATAIRIEANSSKGASDPSASPSK